jgi:hypothetical protein
MNALEKLSGEIKNSKDEYKKLIVEHLVKRIKEDKGLGDDVAKDGKTLDGCMSYIKDKARKQASNGVAVVEGSKVYEWAEDYYREEAGPKPLPKSTPKPTPKKTNKPIPIPQDSQLSLFDDGIIDETDDLWLF